MEVCLQPCPCAIQPHLRKQEFLLILTISEDLGAGGGEGAVLGLPGAGDGLRRHGGKSGEHRGPGRQGWDMHARSLWLAGILHRRTCQG